MSNDPSTAIDRTRLAEQTFGEQELQREILGMFVAELPVLLRTIASTGGVGRAETAHRIVGSAVAIGAMALAETAAALEAEPDDPAVFGRFEIAAEAALHAASDLLRNG